MREIKPENLKPLLQLSKFPIRLQKELSLKSDLYVWEDLQFAPVTTKSKNEGALLVDYAEGSLAIPYTLKKPNTNLIGRQAPYICDFCSTWLRSGHSDTITFNLLDEKHHTVSYRVCSELQCHDNIKGLTNDGMHSRTQLRENITDEGRVKRFRNKLNLIVGNWAMASLGDVWSGDELDRIL